MVFTKIFERNICSFVLSVHILNLKVKTFPACAGSPTFIVNMNLLQENNAKTKTCQLLVG